MAISPNAKLQLTAVTLTEGQYELITEGLYWRLQTAKPSRGGHKKQSATFESHESQPLFMVLAGDYELYVEHRTLGSQSVNGITLVADTLTDEVVYLGAIHIDDQEENYHPHEHKSFNPDSEYKRRQLDRDGQRQYGRAAHDLREPDPLQEQEFGQALSSPQSCVKAHPVLSRSAQFDGVPTKMNPNLTENRHAAENEVRPELRPGHQPQNTYSRSSVPKPTR